MANSYSISPAVRGFTSPRVFRRGRTTMASGVAAAPLLVLLSAVPVAILVTAWSLIPSVGNGAGLASAFVVSLRGATLASLIGAVLGLPLAILLARVRGRLVRALLMTAVTLPVVLPPAAAGIGLLVVFGPTTPIGAFLERFGMHVAFRPAAVVMAQLFVSAPIFVLQATRAVESVERELHDIAAIDGARRLFYLGHVLIPATARTLTVGLVTAWARAMGEFGATMIFAGNLPGSTRTLPLHLYVGLQSGLGVALVSASVLLSCAVIVLVVVNVLDSPSESGRS